MTRFLYLSDSHWGAGGVGYHLQPKYDEHLPELITALKKWMASAGSVDFVLHGGDMVHETKDADIRAAVDCFDLGIPVHLCLGNHDITSAGSLETWERLAPQLFGNPAAVDHGAAGFAIDVEDCVIHVIPNQWGTTPFVWDETQDPHFLDSQMEVLDARLAARPDATHLISTHSPVFAIETGQTGLEGPFHSPAASFAEVVTAVAERHGVTCVLGAHSHANMNKEHTGVNYVTVSSFVETPFEFKLFEVDADSLSMETHNLQDRVEFAADYDWNSTFVQGRACDRSIQKEWTR